LTKHTPSPSAGRPDPQKPEKVAFATRLREAMERKGWTLSETARQTSDVLGADAKFGRAHVWHYLNARAIPRARHLDALSQALQVTPHELLGFASSPTGEESPDSRVSNAITRPAETKSIGSTQVVHAEDFGDGTALLHVSQRVSWTTALKVMMLLKTSVRDDD
jgi:transcriptional regulator with XRE-family HTH domain